MDWTDTTDGIPPLLLVIEHRTWDPTPGPWFRIRHLTSATDLGDGEAPVAAIVADDLPDLSFADAVDAIADSHPGTPVIALTSDASVPHVVSLMRAGAHDVAVRPLGDLQLIVAISKTQAFLRQHGDGLAPRERQVYILLGDGLATSEIAEHLKVSIKTIDGVLIRLRAKLGCDDAMALRQRAVLRRRFDAVQDAVAATIPLAGNARIDQEHNRIISLLCRLEMELITPAVPAETIAATADELLAATHEHSSTEIMMMQIHGYPGIDAHIAEHTAMLDELHRMRRHLDHARPTSIAAFRGFLVHWLGQHIPKCDRPLAAFLDARSGAATTAAPP